MKTNMSLSHSEFISNHNGYAMAVYISDGVITSIDHSKFINNTGSRVLYAKNTNVISISLNEFIDNTAAWFCSGVHTLLYCSREFD